MQAEIVQKLQQEAELQKHLTEAKAETESALKVHIEEIKVKDTEIA